MQRSWPLIYGPVFISIKRAIILHVLCVIYFENMLSHGFIQLLLPAVRFWPTVSSNDTTEELIKYRPLPGAGYLPLGLF